MRIKGNDIVLTKQEYYTLASDQLRLEELFAAGVDNWEGYSERQEEFFSDIKQLYKNVYGIDMPKDHYDYVEDEEEEEE